MNGVIGLAGTLALLLVVGGVIGFADRRRFAPGWLLVAAALVAVNDAALTRVYGLIPDLFPAAHYTWQGKLTALAITLAVAALPAFGSRLCGLMLRQAPGGLRVALPVVALYCLLFLVLAFAFPAEPPTREDVAFQVTLPGLEEEPFYRGVLLYALDRAFAGRWRWLGVDWGWGALLSSALFGLAHAFGYSHGAFAFDPVIFALTALPSLIAVWVRLRTGSVLLPIVMHDFGNTIGLIV